MFKDLKKITWTKPKELFSNFVIVIVFSAVMLGFVSLIDLFVTYIQTLILSII